jgi:hypothetical protein
MRAVWTRGRASFEELQDDVWGREVSDGAIRAAVSRVNSSLLDAGLPVELLAHKGRVSIEKTA